LLALLGLVAAACGSGQTTAESDRISSGVVVAAAVFDGTSGGDDDGDEEESFWFGEAADPSEATRLIEVNALDSFGYAPTALTIAVGEVVTFRVTNAGVLPHEFTLGDFEVQDEHEAEMMAAATEMEGMEMAMMEGGMDGDPNAIAMFPGETTDITWRFTEPGWILMGCHVPGHYTAGMKGTILIEA